MENKNHITAFCKIDSGKINLNHAIIFSEPDHENPVSFLKSAYKHFMLNYPKFYKMDKLCQLAFVCSDLLLKDSRITEKYAAEDIAIVIANSAASLEVDTEHQDTISDENNYYPSPALFVYTLPNILIGEIAIRNKIKGENTFFIFDKFDADFMSSYIDSLLETGKAKCCITGWVDYYENKYTAFLYIAEKGKGVLSIENRTEELKNLYSN
jgi:hypothetical protein